VAKSLLRGDAYQVAEGYLHGWSRSLVALLREFRVGTAPRLRRPSRTVKKRSMTDYSRMSYDALCKIANNDAVADHMSRHSPQIQRTNLSSKKPACSVGSTIGEIIRPLLLAADFFAITVLVGS
jgi:hypothetical protein